MQELHLCLAQQPVCVARAAECALHMIALVGDTDGPDGDAEVCSWVCSYLHVHVKVMLRCVGVCGCLHLHVMMMLRCACVCVVVYMCM